MSPREGKGSSLTPVLVLLSVSFLLGGLTGTAAEGLLSADATAAAFLAALVKDGAQPSLWRELWVLLRWPLLVLAIGKVFRTGLLLPLLFFLRGFRISYGIAALAGSGGAAGWTGAWMLFGPACVLTVPVFFLLGTVVLTDQTEPSARRMRRQSLAFSVLALAACGVLDLFVTPKLLPMALRLCAVT